MITGLRQLTPRRTGGGSLRTRLGLLYLYQSSFFQATLTVSTRAFFVGNVRHVYRIHIGVTASFVEAGFWNGRGGRYGYYGALLYDLQAVHFVKDVRVTASAYTSCLSHLLL
jgi:hypothetical protein